VIRRVGSPEARHFLANDDLKKAYKLAAQSTHSDKANIDKEAIKELNSLETEFERLVGDCHERC
jgi:DnaJ-class molecular chaperone